MEKKKTTFELKEDARKLKLDEFLCESSANKETVNMEYLRSVMFSKNLTIAQVAKKAEIENSYLGKIMNGTRRPSRSVFICICIGLSLNIDETNLNLKRNGFAELSANNSKWDSIVLFGIVNGKKIGDINNDLDDNKLKLLIK